MFKNRNEKLIDKEMREYISEKLKDMKDENDKIILNKLEEIQKVIDKEVADQIKAALKKKGL